MCRCVFIIFSVLVLALTQGEDPKPRRRGSCPPTLSVDICEPACGPDLPCEQQKQLCCPTACGGTMCVDAMSERHFVDYVKEGSCPEFPRGPWVCSHTCTGDSDCPRKLKCCPNRCGALTCMKADNVESVANNNV